MSHGIKPGVATGKEVQKIHKYAKEKGFAIDETGFNELMELQKKKSREDTKKKTTKYIYENFLTDGPCGKTSHKLLHTNYTKRGKFIA